MSDEPDRDRTDENDEESVAPQTPPVAPASDKETGSSYEERDDAEGGRA